MSTHVGQSPTPTLFGIADAASIVPERRRPGSVPAREPARMTTAELVAYVEAETAAGRHSPAFTTVCDQCRRWVDAVWKITVDHKRLCYACAEGEPAGTPAPKHFTAKTKGQQ
jgi:hypothetical protein